MQTAHVYRIPTSGPEDVSGLQTLFDKGLLAPGEIIAVLGKTEGNGCVNDFTRGYSTFVLKTMLAEALGVSRSEIAKRVAFIMSGGTEGVISPHLTVFARKNSNADAASQDAKRLSIGVSHSRVFVPRSLAACRKSRASPMR